MSDDVEVKKTDDEKVKQTYPDAPNEVYVSHANYIRIDLKVTTARRLSGWLKDFADYCDLAGNTTTSDHARHVANILERKVEDA